MGLGFNDGWRSLGHMLRIGYMIVDVHGVEMHVHFSDHYGTIMY